jgi:hypothetical protein
MGEKSRADTFYLAEFDDEPIGLSRAKIFQK